MARCHSSAIVKNSMNAEWDIFDLCSGAFSNSGRAAAATLEKQFVKNLSP